MNKNGQNQKKVLILFCPDHFKRSPHTPGCIIPRCLFYGVYSLVIAEKIKLSTEYIRQTITTSKEVFLEELSDATLQEGSVT